jgi:demethylmenaquinone methyltransferase/2-methoxy-6-polyprenyl-1,4-benzoquinol methylase
MENNIDNPNQNIASNIPNYICLSEFRKPLFIKIINSLGLTNGSKGLDAGCGIGFYTTFLAESIGEEGIVIGVDLSEDFIRYANKNKRPRVQFEIGNINSLGYEDNFFDWIWSADTVWPGPKDLGCPNEDPIPIIKDFYRILKPGGKLFLLFWSSQKFLPGYPLLEARLNTTSSAIAPFVNGMNPKYHILNAKYWLEKSGFKDVTAKTFLEDVNMPLDENTRKSLNIFFQMLWNQSKNELLENEWKEFKRLCNPNSNEHIFNNQHYYGFYSYTLFQGIK